MRQAGWRLGVKRAIDVTVATAALALTTPAIAAAALAIRAMMGPPALFRQVRPGRRGQLFAVYKLRTMAAGPGDDAARLTPLGRALRGTSLDELPQLWNVLRGDMSLVGPRPLLVQYLDRYTPEQARRHDVLPGVTGWAQINGRNALTHEERFRLDVWYVDNWSLSIDLRILATTVWRVLSRSGISADGHATMPEFMGTAAEADPTRAC
jgi:lipopolysaccharide/colanic/teichoic acid biosynthesis glycosyltransferase